jgi:4-hydroxy-4-methyl-2-oxoglutarate aldolase
VTEIGSATLASAGGDRVELILGLQPVFPAARALGPALTVRSAPADSLAIHHAVAVAERGDVIVLAVGGERGVAHCGDLIAGAALARGVAGIVVDGAIRDHAAIVALGLPVFHLGCSPRGPGKAGPGEIGVPVRLAGVTVHAGDLVCADADGVAVVRRAHADEIVAAAEALEAREREIVAAIERGESTVSILGLKELA